jgi:DNA polymerase I-like protein with 3'-5' exonuclease and polymerase domains
MNTYFVGNSLIEYENIPNKTIIDVIEYCKTKFIIGLDIETGRKYKKGIYDEFVFKPGLDPYLSRVVMLQIGDLENNFVIDSRVIDLKPLKEILENDKILKVGHNLKFEGKHLLASYGMIICNVWDTMICERILYNGLNLKYSLEALSNRYLGIESVNKTNTDLFTDCKDISEIEKDIEDEYDELEFMDKKETIYIDKSIRLQFVEYGDKPFTLEQIKYGYNDIVYPLKIYEIQKQGRLVNGELYKPVNGFNLENKITQVLAKIELRGIKVNQQGWLDLFELNKKILIEKLKTLNEWISNYYPTFCKPPDLFSSKPICKIEWSSSKQVIEFAKFLEFCPKEKSKQTKKYEFSVGAKALFKLLTNENKDNFYSNKTIPLIDKDDVQAFILNYLLMKKYQQLTTTFGDKWLRYVHPITHRVHTNFIQLMNTGRLSSTSVNLQQLPNGKMWRELFIAEKGYKIVATDYSTQEIRVSAEITGVKDLQNFFIEKHPIFGSDFHSFAATNMFRVIRNEPDLVINPKLNKKERNISKSMTFKLNYGKLFVF